MSESLFTQPPSYESSQLDRCCEDPELPLPSNPQGSESIRLLPVIPPLVPVRRAATGSIQASSSRHHGTQEALPASPDELYPPGSMGVNIDDLMRNSVNRGYPSPSAPIRSSTHMAILGPRPTSTVEFVFAPAGPNAMWLIPPADDRDTRPRYYITVLPNCFMPLSHITTVYRGSSEDAPRVGEFEMGIFAGPSYRQIGNHPAENLEDVLKKKGIRTNGKWTWSRKAGSTPPNLYWNCNMTPFICSTQPPDSIDSASIGNNAIAWFIPRHTNRGSQGPTMSSQLQVTARGQNQMMFDDIIMSILAIQRRILRPTTLEVQGLFNDCTPGF